MYSTNDMQYRLVSVTIRKVTFKGVYMSKGYGLLQNRIIELLEFEGLDDGYWRTILSICGELGALRPSVHRAMKRLIDDGVVVKRMIPLPCHSQLGMNKQTAEYMLATNATAQSSVEEVRNADAKAEEEEALRLGISVDSLRFDKFFAERGR